MKQKQLTPGKLNISSMNRNNFKNRQKIYQKTTFTEFVKN